MTKDERHQLDRMIIGNQIAIMRTLALTVSGNYKTMLEIRVHDQKIWWRDKYGEEVGFASGLDERPTPNK